MANDNERGTNFIQQQIERDLVSGRYGGRVATRFPPEPNGYLHIGHAKSICLNFGLARKYGGTCNLRYDDTNPSTEDQEYVDAILRDLRWLGFEPDAVYFASDYYGQIYEWAELLVKKGLAYVDDQQLDELREARGTVTEAGRASACRDRSPEENLRLLREMRDGLHPDGSKVLRAKIDLGHVNMKMRDPLLYRIRRQHHYRTGDAWCIYPMYDWAHGQSDAIERITHSICTLEFENNRELYDWFLQAIGTEAIGTDQLPNQYEFARLNLTHTVMSKRKLLRLVREGLVDGWDDPRMPTIAGMRHRGVTPEALRELAEVVGVARAQSVVDISVFEHCIRDDLNRRSPRRMAVIDPLKVVLTNWEPGRVETLTAPSFPPDVGLPGERAVPFGGELYIEREDFSEAPPKGWRRLVPGGEVRLRYAWVMRCDEVIKDEAGRVVELRCSVDHDTLGRNPEGRSVKGTLHWVAAHAAVPATIKLYDRLCAVADPEAQGDFMNALNPNSLQIVQGFVEPAAVGEPGDRWQFERHGYFFRPPGAGPLVFHRTIGLKDGFEKAEEQGREAKAEVKASSAEEQARLRAEHIAGRLARDPRLRAAYERLLPVIGSDDEAFRVAEEPARVALLDAAVAAGGPALAVARWLVNAQEAKGDLSRLDGAALGRTLQQVESGRWNAAGGRRVLAELLAGGGDPEQIGARLGLDAGVDRAALERLVDEVFARCAAEVSRWQGGEDKLTGFLVGQVMKAAKGIASGDDVKAAVMARR
jgi:glutaminyl-tRNA synthetase